VHGDRRRKDDDKNEVSESVDPGDNVHGDRRREEDDKVIDAVDGGRRMDDERHDVSDN